MGKFQRFVKLSTVILIVVSLASILVYNKSDIVRIAYPLLNPTPKNLEFSLKKCNEDVSAYDHNDLGIKEVTWLNDSTIFVKAHISTFCGGENISFPSYRISDNTLILKYTRVKENAITKCSCAKEINYTIHDIPNSNYEVRLEDNSL